MGTFKSKTVKLGYTESRDGLKKWWYFDYGRGKGERPSTGMFTWVRPATLLEKTHNKTIMGRLETVRQRLLDLAEGIVLLTRLRQN